MTLLYPGALWRPMPGQEKRPKRLKGRGVGFHVAVYMGPSIYEINLRTGNDAHLYVRLDGSVEQNVDLDLQAWAGLDGNPSMLWVETAGGLGSTRQLNAEPWTPPQAETLAQIAAWAHRTEGTPLGLMPDSRPASRGIGTHRLGIQHSRGVGAVPGWLIAGGERWTSHLGKECPGDAKVAQVPAVILPRAQQIAAGGPSAGAPAPLEDDMPAYTDWAQQDKNNLVHDIVSFPMITNGNKDIVSIADLLNALERKTDGYGHRTEHIEGVDVTVIGIG